MAEKTEPFKLKHRHLQAIIRILQGYTDPDADGESDVNLGDKAKDDLSLCSRTLNSGVAGIAAKDDETAPTEGGVHGNKRDETIGKQESARGDQRARGNDAAATRRALAAAASDGRGVGPTSPFSGIGGYTPGRAPPLARDGSIISVDSIFGGTPTTTGDDVSVNDIFGKQPPTLANG